MSRFPDDIDEFWQHLEKTHEYTTPYQIQLEQDIGGGVSISCKWPYFLDSPAVFQLDLFESFSQKAVLSDLLHLISRTDLDTVSPARILELFKEGKFGLSCMIFQGLLSGDLAFRVTNNILQALDATRGVSLEIGNIFETPMEYVEFTTNYFLENPLTENLQDNDIKN